jgi:hypothetical protein
MVKAAAQTPEAVKPVSGTDTVTVACKIPQGMSLQLHEPREITEVTMGGSRTVKQFFPIGEAFKINGSAHAQNEGPRCRTVGGFALTEGVPAELWGKWMEQTGKFHPAVIAKHLFAFPDMGRAVDAAKEARKVKTGLERLNPHDLPVLNKNFPIKTADEAVAEIGNVEE